MPTRQCPHCGKDISALLTQCCYCREAVPEVPQIRRENADSSRFLEGRGKIRIGLLCMLLAVVVHFFAGGYSMMQMPVPVQAFVTIYLSPLLLLCGLGQASYGYYLKRTA